MLLDKKVIQSLTVGAAESWFEEDGVHFSKFTREQILSWERMFPNLIVNVKATTGIRMDFHTDSSFVSFSVTGGKHYEMKIDGFLSHRFTAHGENTVCTFCVELGNPGQMKHIVFALPSHNHVGVICNVEVADDAKVEKHIFDQKVLFLGDSITQGWNSGVDMLSYAYQVSDSLNAESVIQGVGGSVFTPETLADFGFLPDTVFVAYGTNDFCYFESLAELESKATGYLQKVGSLYPNAKIYVITPIWRQDHLVPRRTGTFRQCCDSIGNIAQKMRLSVIDGSALVPHIADFFADDVHPNGIGFMMYARNLLNIL